MNCLLDIALVADKVTGPVLWQHGEADQLVPPAESRRGMALLRNADVTELSYPGARPRDLERDQQGPGAGRRGRLPRPADHLTGVVSR
jgi:pimeloyl-ACP methyl ester carboxylesterase